jgi:hypothetical protein
MASNVCQIFYLKTLDTLDIMLYTLDIHWTIHKEAIMARAFLGTTEKYPVHLTASPAVHYESTCIRCGGLMVTDFSMDVLFCIGETEFAAKRCVQCGEVVDPVILKNRGTQQAPMAGQPVRRVLLDRSACSRPRSAWCSSTKEVFNAQSNNA